MEYKELLQKLQEVFPSVDAFAYHELGEIQIPESHKFSKETEEKIGSRDLLWNKVKDHPGYSNNSLRDADYHNLFEAWRKSPNDYELKSIDYLTSIGIGPMEEVAQYGGEGKGDTWYSVKYFPLHNIYIRVDGWYSSYNGTDFSGWEDDCKQVVPQQKTITVYE